MSATKDPPPPYEELPKRRSKKQRKAQNFEIVIGRKAPESDRILNKFDELVTSSNNTAAKLGH
ncbi:hypothetical protein McaMca56_003010 [Microsporum canis]